MTFAKQVLVLAGGLASLLMPVSNAEAQEVSGRVAQWSASDEAGVLTEDSARFRFGIAGAVVAGSASGYSQGGAVNVSAGVIAPALQLDLGVQFRRDAALYLRAEVGSILLTSGGSGYLVAEWTPTPGFSIGTGLGVDMMSLFWVGQSAGGNTLRNTWTGLSVPIVFGHQFLDRETWEGTGLRPAARIGVELAAGVEPGTWVFGWHANLTIGFVLM